MEKRILTPEELELRIRLEKVQDMLYGIEEDDEEEDDEVKTNI